jgi:hypothetical protein
MDKPYLMVSNTLRHVFGICLALLGGIVAWHHPVSGWLGGVVFLLVVGVAAYAFAIWPIVLLVLMPVIGFAPWTGWISFEEFDLLILAIAAGGYLRAVLWRDLDVQARSRGSSGRTIRIWLLALYGLSVFISMFRGFQDAGGFDFSWFQGYFGPMNSVRLAKSFFLAALLLPLWLRLEKMYPERSVTSLVWGCAAGLGLASLAAILERAAFTGLLNFSSDYRTTALFWETHVGGAAFDGYLAISLPFAMHCYFRSTDLPKRLISGAILVLAGYACLTTFSRGVYLAVPVGLVIFVILKHWRARSGELVGLETLQSTVRMIGGIAVFGGMAYWVFPTSGYRGMLAVLVTFYLMVILLPMAANGRPVGGRSIFIGLVGASIVAFLGASFPKGAYGVFGLGMAFVAVGLGVAAIRQWKLAISIAGYWLAVLGCGLIAHHWGGSYALQMMFPVCIALVLGLSSVFFVRLPVQESGRHLGLLGGMALIGLLVATFFGGQYMTDRFATTERDFEHRLAHWKGGLGLMDGYDFLFGKGLGRFPAGYFFATPPSEHPGGFRLIEKNGESSLLISGGRHVLGWGELFRVSQRVSPGTAPYLVEWDIKADSDVRLHFEICEKHLLYNAVCVANSATVKGNRSEWQHVQLALAGDSPSRGDWYAPKIITFSLAVENRGGMAYLDNIALRDGYGEALLSNGDFSQGLARWFSSSDRHHMPWHMKNLFMHVHFDQGFLGLIVLCILIFTAFFRLTVRGARRHPLAPALAGGLAGFIVVGMFDSLLDVPRLSVLFYFLLMVSLVIRTGPNDGRGSLQPLAQR